MGSRQYKKLYRAWVRRGVGGDQRRLRENRSNHNMRRRFSNWPDLLKWFAACVPIRGLFFLSTILVSPFRRIKENIRPSQESTRRKIAMHPWPNTPPRDSKSASNQEDNGYP